ncbi:hypothetical protein ABAC460_16155 [Asticcacaulis sp. AC460]|uniref:hypothetical protein n=1 Tax=Asticcacaulis sp. AC460 TaxID=1282360 RepID=UPI0003C3AC48|nr:hypothetical protein [Asticcacaulis sp. AC460]ESQ88193.1 hypothetical protein ABAC460_16155 [Asticcacaulis sp. AC460]
MKIVTAGLLVLGVAVVAVAGTLGGLSRSPDPRVWYAAAQVEALDRGWVSVRQVDWEHLKTGAGAYGVGQLKRLKRDGTDEVRLTAATALKYDFADIGICGDAPCAGEVEFFDVVPRTELLQQKFYTPRLTQGQVLPPDFAVDTISEVQIYCGHDLKEDPSTCTLRMQDFNGDGKAEVYLEAVRPGRDRQLEDPIRSLTIFRETERGWEELSRVFLRDADGSVWFDRPFPLEPSPPDRVLINNVAFRFVAYPGVDTADKPADLAGQAAMMAPLGRRIAEIPVVFPKGRAMPAGLAGALASGRTGFIALTRNPRSEGSKGVPPVQYTRPPACQDAKTCRAIVADLDHDGDDDVILIGDPSPTNGFAPLDATLLQNDGSRWTVAANVCVRKEIVPDIDAAAFVIKPSEWGVIRLGRNLYPVIGNPGCEVLEPVL